MKKLLYLIIAILCIGTACCSESNEEYVIKGTTSQSRLNGKKVFLSPYGKPGIRDSIGVDSAFIKDGKFEIHGHRGKFLARVTIEINERFGTQDLLVVTEPGVINVVIDSVSSGHGTPQNDLLQAWKEFHGPAQDLNLPSAPKQFLHYFEENDRPQPKLDRMLENGMAVSIGRLREDTQYDYKFVCLSHNTLRGAAGGAVLLAELLAAKGYFD